MNKETAEKVLRIAFEELVGAQARQLMLDLLVTGSAVMPDGEVVRMFQPTPELPLPEEVAEVNASPQIVAVVLQDVRVWTWRCPKCRTENFIQPLRYRGDMLVPQTVMCRECYGTFKNKEAT